MSSPVNLQVYLDEVVDWLSNRKKDLNPVPPLLNPKEHHPNHFVTLDDLGAEEMIENRLLIPDSMIEFLLPTTVCATAGVTASLLDNNSKTTSPVLSQIESNVDVVERHNTNFVTNSDGSDSLYLKKKRVRKQNAIIQGSAAFQGQRSSRYNVSESHIQEIDSYQPTYTTRISTTPLSRSRSVQDNKHATIRQMVPEAVYNAGQVHISDGDAIHVSNSSSALQQMKLSSRGNPTEYYQNRTIQKPIKPCNMNGGVLQVKLSPESNANQSASSNVTPHTIYSLPDDRNPHRRYMQTVISSQQRVSPYPVGNHLQDVRYHSRNNFKQKSYVQMPSVVYDHQVSSPATVTGANQMVYLSRSETVCSGPNRIDGVHERLVDGNYLDHLTSSVPKKTYYCRPNSRYPHGLSGSINSMRCDQLREVQSAPSYTVPQYPENYLQNPPRQQHMY